MRLTTMTSILAVKHKVLRALMLLTALLLLPSALYAQGKTAYALWTEGNATLTFLYTDNVYEVGKSRSGYQITNLWSGDEVLNTPAAAAPGWSSIKKKIKTVVFDSSFDDARPTSIAYWFDNSDTRSESAGTLSKIEGIEHLNTSKVTSMCYAFFRCASLLYVNLGKFNTANVTDMSYMFMGCNTMLQIDLASFNTENVLNMSNMFAQCTSLMGLDVSGFNTGNVTDMSSMFNKCSTVSELNVSGFDTKNVTTFANMFNGCAGVKEIDLSNFDVSKITSAANMFASCSELATIRAAEGADWRSIADISNMFSGCSRLLAVSKDGTSCKYQSGKNLPFVCTNGEGYFTSIEGYMITYVGYTSIEQDFQMIAKDVKTVKLKKNEFTVANKVFGSWNTEKDGSGTSYYDEETIEISGNMILYSQWGRDVNLCDVTINPLSFTYSGAECKPSVTLEDNYTKLTIDTDYKVVYDNNINAGEASITIRGIKEYAGTIIKTFTIKPVNIGVASITPQRQILAYNGEAQSPTYILRNGDTKLVEGEDYEVSGRDGNSAVGDYAVSFTGKGNYTGIATATYTISAQNAYAVWTEDNATLTFMMSEDAPTIGGNYNGSTVTAVWTGDDVLKSPQNNAPAWNSTVSSKVKIVNFDASFAEASPKSIAYWFDNSDGSGNSAQTLIQIKNIKNLNTSAVTSMEGAFNNCSALTLIDVSKFNTDLVTCMNSMFYECSKATKIDVSGFYTESCTDMANMFYGCSKVTKLATDNFDTKNVTSMAGMFANCIALTEAAVNGFSTENVVDMQGMFSGCTALKTVDVSKFNTANVSGLGFVSMFEDCSSLTALNVKGFKTSNATSFANMFKDCSKLASLDVSGFNTSAATDFGDMFYDCESLGMLSVSDFKTDNATNLSGMFYNCQNLTKIDVANFNTGSVKDFSKMFMGCAALAELKVDGFNTAAALEMNSMFYGCSSIKALNVGKFDVTTVSDISLMFGGCKSLTTIHAKSLTDWSNVANAENVFTGCNALVGVGADGSVCKYEDGKTAANTCTEGNGYFTPDNIFVITYNNNIDNQLAYQVVAKPVTASVKLVPNTFVNDAYNFVSWNTAADGTGTTYKDEAEIRVGSDMVMYAQWGRDIELCTATIEPYYYTFIGKTLYAHENGGRLVVKDGDKTLRAGVDYTTKYPSDCINVGEYAVQVFGKGVYAGEISAKYAITPYDLSDVAIEPENAVFIYTGEPQCPEFVLKDGHGNTLTKDVDYEIITDVSQNIEGEEYMVEIEGKGNYEGYNYAFYAIKNAYAVWTETNNTLTFVLDENGYKPGVSYLDGHKVSKVWSGDAIAKSPADGQPAWAEILGSLTTVNFKESFADVHPVSTAYWFAGAEKLKNFIDFENLNTDKVTSMANMFAGCKSIDAIDLSALVTDNVEDMSNMFSGCAALTELNVKNFNTAKVANMNGMFAQCTSLAKILASSSANWTRTNPTIENMFAGDKALAGIGGDGSFCLYADGEDYPYTCVNGKGYFTDDDVNIITFDDNTAAHNQVFQSVRKSNTAPITLKSNEFNNPGFVFISWNTEADGKGTAYDDRGSVQISENITFYATWKKDIAACQVSFDLAKTIYDGEAQKPAFTLKYGDYTLVEGKDFAIDAYNENINASNTKPYVAVRGRGDDFAGTFDFHFPIAPRDLKEVAVEITSDKNLVYNKQAQTPTYVLVFGELNLAEGVDYTASPTDQNIDVNNYTVTFTGTGNYTGTNTTEYSITPRDIAIAKVATDHIEYEYNGAAVEPVTTVSDGDDVLTAGKDYEITFADNTNAGEAKISITGKGNYTGTLDDKTFIIVPLDMTKVTVTPQNAQLPYNRTAQNPDFVLSVNGNNLKNTEYTITGELNKTDIGEYTVIFSAVEPGNYKNSTTTKYSITKLDFSDHAKIVFENDKTNFPYTGSLITPVVSVVDEFGNTLVANTDYTLENPGNTEMGAYTIKAVGSGNYTGEITAEYRIVEKSLEDAVVTFVDGNEFTFNGKAFEPEVAVIDGVTVLVAGTDYNVEYNNNTNASDKAEVIINGIGKYDQSKKTENFTILPLNIIDAEVVVGDPVVYNGAAQVGTFTITDTYGNVLTVNDYAFGDYSNNISAGEYTAVINGVGNYTGSIDANYIIAGRSIADVNVVANEDKKVYTGSEQTISLTVTDGDLTLVEGVDYVEDCGGAINVGTATATVKGIGNYSGVATMTAQFEITAADFSQVTITANDDWKVAYTGSGVKPDVTITDTYGNTLVEGTDYTVGDYSNNIEVGDQYPILYTGIGNYGGSIGKYYTIKPRGIEDVEIVYQDGKTEWTYTGADIKPVEKVIDLGKELRQDIDYKISYTNNREPGTAIITITGMGLYAGEGSKVETFVINKIDMADVTIAQSATDFPYNKQAQQPVFTLTDQNSHVLVAGDEFTITGNDGNINAGEYTVTFAAVEGSHYTGEATTKYTITPQQVNIDDINIVYGPSDFTYTGKAQEPTISVKYVDEDLVRDTDYEVVFSDNVNAGTVHVTINGKGNYDGFALPANDYVIKAYTLTDDMVSADKTTFVYGGGAYSPKYTLTDANDNLLVLNTDYTVEGNTGNGNAGTYTVKFAGTGNYTGEINTTYTIEPYDISRETVVVEFKDGISEFEYTGEEIIPDFDLKINGYALQRDVNYTVSGATSKVNAGRYEITAQGIGNFTGTKPINYRILPRNISGTASIEFYDGDLYIETGEEIKPEIFVSDGTSNLADTDYEVAYENNVVPGTAKVNVTGIGNYEGFEMSQEFTILPMKPAIKFSVDEDLVYGNSLVGKNIKAVVEEVYKGEITYDVSGVLVPGNYTITATYTPNDETTKEATASTNVVVGQRLLIVSGVEVEKTKDYDGTTAAKVITSAADIQAQIDQQLINGDKVTVTAIAEFAAAKPGTHSIKVTYALSGDDANKYIVRSTDVQGEIKTVPIVATFEIDKEQSNSTAADYPDVTGLDDFEHYCAGDEIVFNTTASSGMPSAFRVTFSDGQIPDITGEYPADGKIVVEIPSNFAYGKYTATLHLENSETGTTKDFEPITFYIDGLADGTEDAIVKQKWDDVVYVSNAKREFVAEQIQWYRDGTKLNETGQYYQEKNGLVPSATYYAKIATINGDVVLTCPYKAAKPVSKSAVALAVQVYPNPATANQQFTVEIVDAENIDGNVSIMIFNHSGMLVERIDNASAINHVTLPAGQYTGTAVVDGKKMTFRVIVQ